MSTNVLDKIVSRVHKRRRNWNTFEVYELPHTVEEATIIGSYSVCMLESRNRIININKSITVDGVKETPSSLARDYLYSAYRRGPVGTKAQNKNFDDSKTKPLPSVSRPCKFYNGIYVDIQAAYWSILNCIGWNIDYNPPYWLANGRPPTDFPWPDNKSARNCLVSSGACTPMVVYMPESRPVAIQTVSGLKNKQLIGLISDVLNSIAAFAIRQGAVYINTDGYILTNEHAADNVMSEIAEWGLRARVKNRGMGSVSGPGVYSIGIHASNRKMEGDHWIYSVVEPDYARWLKKSFSKIALSNLGNWYYEYAN